MLPGGALSLPTGASMSGDEVVEVTGVAFASRDAVKAEGRATASCVEVGDKSGDPNGGERAVKRLLATTAREK